MIGMKYIEEMIKLVIWSGYVKHEKPLSLIIVANPESGKTKSLLKYANNKRLITYTDLTAYGIRKDVIPKVEVGSIKHLIIPDLLKPLNRGQWAVADFITLMSCLIEEGVGNISTFNESVIREQSQCGLITSVTPDFFLDKRRNWTKLGFISRCLIVSYSYTKDMINEILELHKKAIGEIKENEDLKLPDSQMDVISDEKYNEMILPEIKMMANKIGTHGFRMLRHHITLLKASALMDGRGYVDERDVELIKKLIVWMNFDLKPIISYKK